MARKLALVALALMLLSNCGDDLTSIKINPTVADAKNFHDGKVQFTATGTFGGSSNPVPLPNVNWCVGTTTGFCYGNINAGGTIDGNGLASCTGNRAVTILAGRSSSIGMPDRGIQLDTFGTATLICP